MNRTRREISEKIAMGRLRIASARAMIRLGKLLQSLAVVVMKPADLIEFSRRTYASPSSVDDWTRPELVDGGLSPEENLLLERSPVQEGRMLLLGLGGGREAVVLAKRGFSVTGVDFVAGMVERAKAHAARQGAVIEGLVQEISRLDVAPEGFDMAWLSARMYSCIPTRQRRVRMLRRIAKALRAGGCFICLFHWDPQQKMDIRVLRMHRAVARLSFGHLQYEPGDRLWFNREFIHAFADETELRTEFAEGGFDLLHLFVSNEKKSGGALLRGKVGNR